MDVLAVTGLSKSYDGVRALHDVSFGVRAGELVAMIGPNGAGKTTLFNILTGFMQPTSGTIHFNGDLVRELAPIRSSIAAWRAPSSSRAPLSA
jgi:branched-chain amino acid transport system ATP-binding protein